MRMKIRHTGTLAATLLLGFSSQLLAQNSPIHVNVYPNPAGLMDQVTLQVRVSGSEPVVREPVVPKLTGLKRVSGPKVSSPPKSWSQVFSYIFLPEREGEVRIPPIKVSVAGKTYRSEMVSLSVVKGTPPTDPREDRKMTRMGFRRLSLQRNSELRIAVDLDKTTVFVGEPVTLSYKAITQDRVGAFDLERAPDLPGFWVEPVPITRMADNVVKTGKAEIVGDVIRKNQRFENIVHRQLLFPIQPGRIQMPSKVIGLHTMSISLTPEASVYRKTPPFFLEVLPLPELGRPTSFSGAVGEFEIESEIDRTEVQVGKPVQLKVVVRGKGNLKLGVNFSLPSLPDFQILSVDTTEQFKVSDDGPFSEKTWQCLLVAKFPGATVIPQLEFSYFSPRLRSYAISRSLTPFKIQVKR